jgi:hypothetical protein
MEAVRQASERPRQVQQSDEELVWAIREGETREAWPCVLERYSALLERTARAYAMKCRRESHETVDDTTSALYVFMAERIHDSIVRYYRGECALGVWIRRLIGDRRQIVKAFLMQTERGRHRADTRLPKSMENRPPLDRHIYRRLVWGKDPTWIAYDLGLSETASRVACDDILETLRRTSPRVAGRIAANRQSMLPVLSIERSPRNDGSVGIDPPDTAPLPDVLAERSILLREEPRASGAISRGLARMGEGDVRVLVLVHDHGWSLSEVAEAAPRIGIRGADARHKVDYRITRALRLIAIMLLEAFDRDRTAERRDATVQSLKDLFREHGVSRYLARSFDWQP